MDTQYFWLEREDLPAGIGFGLFTKQHVFMLLLCAAVILLLVWLPDTHKRKLPYMAAALAAGNLLRDIFLMQIGRMSAAYLPLHLCSFSIFIYLLHAFLHDGKWKNALGEIGLVTLLPGALCGVLFPNWADYPLWNFMSLHSFL